MPVDRDQRGRERRRRDSMMMRNWRVWILLLLLLGPMLAYVVLGFLWLLEHSGPLGFRGELVTYATIVWILSGVLFAWLASRWTKSSQNLLPPLDWEQPSTFPERDRKAWELVQQAAERGDQLPPSALETIDTYIEIGRDLAHELARHYRPKAIDPFEHVPVIDMLTAIQLASEDLAQLCREIPGGDLIAPSHWKRAVQAAGYLQRANEIYTFLLPLFQPAAGVVRLGTQKLMVQPAWKNMQQNLMRWFLRAYINRLGVHLVELYSGRLAIGAEQYRRLTRKRFAVEEVEDEASGRLVIGFCGAAGVGKSSLLSAVERERVTSLASVREKLRDAGLDPGLSTLLRDARLVEIPAYPLCSAGKESARDRARRRETIRKASEVDLLVLVVDVARDEFSAEIRLIEDLQAWFAEHPGRVIPPILVVLTGTDRLDLADSWAPPYEWNGGRRPREIAVRQRFERLRLSLPPLAADIIAVSLHPQHPYGIVENLLPAVAILLHRAERAFMLRHLEAQAGRSRMGRVLGQLGRHGRRLVRSARNRKSPEAPRP